MSKMYDFGGWATRNNVKCSDGRTIMKDAFKDCDGIEVPLVWNHRHDEPTNVLGHALLENKDEGVYAFCTFNDTENAKVSKELVEHGDVSALSIFANQLKEHASQVLHGAIKEVSLVIAGANPGAFIDMISFAHGEEADGEAIIYTGEPLFLRHSNEDEKADEKKDEDLKDDETVAEVLDSLTEKQKDVVGYVVGEALKNGNENNENNSKGGEKIMKHNVFDQSDCKENTFLSHSDQEAIIRSAKSSNVGTLRAAISQHTENNETLAHGINNIDTLFPDYHDVRPGAPEMLTTDQGWVTKVLQKVHRSPISRIRTRQADIRNISKLRAQGYKKGDKKKEIGNFDLIHRTTDPQTVYVKSKIDRDDIVDIVDFEVVGYLYAIDRMNLNEELATAIMIGDGRQTGEEGKIAEDKIRPIWQDDDLYTIHVDVDYETMKEELNGSNTSANFGENYIRAEATIQAALYAREKYKGSGLPDFYCTPHLVNVMLMARDLNGRRIYSNIDELKATLNVNEIITAEQFADKERTDSSMKKHKLLGIMVNLADYHVGATKGGEITHFTNFDIDFNQEKSLLETRCSGANTRPLSAIALEEPVGE